VVDQVGNANTTKKQITFSGAGAYAPDSIQVDGANVTVDISSTGSLLIGKTVVVISGADRFSHVLTEADLKQGKVVINTFTPGLDVSAFIVSDAGNPS
ncbi:hypothetical protein, partial [Pseudomonas serboccidentalis]|uniref:hypothetical protein n=1 Tax=Pseudomonas serboccidentalis TaxID=2964670 RepID=UPI0039E1B4D8